MTVTSRADDGFGASWTTWMTRAEVKNSTRTIRTGTIVQASSIWLLPYTWGGSLASFSSVRRYRMMARVIRPTTMTKMAPVTPSTNIERSNRVFACPEAGEKMFGTWPPPATGTLVPATQKSHTANARPGTAPVAIRPATVSTFDHV